MTDWLRCESLQNRTFRCRATSFSISIVEIAFSSPFCTAFARRGNHLCRWKEKRWLGGESIRVDRKLLGQSPGVDSWASVSIVPRELWLHGGSKPQGQALTAMAPNRQGELVVSWNGLDDGQDPDKHGNRQGKGPIPWD